MAKHKILKKTDNLRELIPVEVFILVAVLMMMLMIILFIMPALRTGSYNAKREADINNLSVAIDKYYQQNNRMPVLSDLVDEGEIKSDFVTLAFYDGINLTGKQQTSLVSDQSYYINQYAIPSIEDLFPNSQNLHIWVGYQCGDPIVATEQDQTYTETTLQSADSRSYAIVYKIEMKSDFYKCYNSRVETV